MKKTVAALLTAATAATLALGSPGTASAHRKPAPSRVLSIGPRHGIVTPHQKAVAREARAKHLAFATNTTPLTYHGTASSTTSVSRNPKVYLVFWGDWSKDNVGARAAVISFFQGLGGADDGFSNVTMQYCQGIAKGATSCPAGSQFIVKPAASPLAGVWDDPVVPNLKPRDSQIAAEANKARQHFGQPAGDTNAQYVIASAPGMKPGGFPKFCAYHSAATVTGGKIAYTNLPYIPDLGINACSAMAVNQPTDGYLITESHEYAETITDWDVSTGWLDASGNENADKCIDTDAYITLDTGTFAVESSWSNRANACKLTE